MKFNDNIDRRFGSKPRNWPYLRQINLHCYYTAEGLSITQLQEILGINNGQLRHAIFYPTTERDLKIRRQLEERYETPIATLTKIRSVDSCFLESTVPLVEKICRLRKEGYTIKVIGLIVNRSTATVANHLVKAGFLSERQRANRELPPPPY